MNRWAGGGVVAGPETQQSVFERGEVGEVGGLDDLALHDGEVDLDLVEPGRVDREVDEHGAGPGLAHPLDRGRTGVGGAVVHDPEHPPCRGVGLLCHDLFDELR